MSAELRNHLGTRQRPESLGILEKRAKVATHTAVPERGSCHRLPRLLLRTSVLAYWARLVFIW